jgi:hypothetical protein
MHTRTHSRTRVRNIFMSMVTVQFVFTFLLCLISVCSFLVTNMCSTSLPGGNHVDGLPLVSNTTVRDIKFKMACGDSFALDFKYVSVVIIVYPQHPPEIGIRSRFCICAVSNRDYLVPIMVTFRIFSFFHDGEHI